MKKNIKILLKMDENERYFKSHGANKFARLMPVLVSFFIVPVAYKIVSYITDHESNANL